MTGISKQMIIKSPSYTKHDSVKIVLEIWTKCENYTQNWTR